MSKFSHIGTIEGLRDRSDRKREVFVQTSAGDDETEICILPAWGKGVGIAMSPAQALALIDLLEQALCVNPHVDYACASCWGEL